MADRIYEAREKDCAHRYIRVILECINCNRQITNVNKIIRKVPGKEQYVFDTEHYVNYESDSE